MNSYLDEEGFPQNEDLLSVGLEAYSLKKTGDTDWDDDIYEEMLEELDKKGLKPADEIEFDWEEDDWINYSQYYGDALEKIH
ncbi:hypothetical protein [Risungbinella massiliensis]|uniref:hypothetical protein n=1 Tax=Risungbinella massiliensis TaxID=1329796 RepID=UPI001E430C3C|nr:hypothetical protein [Risungbinella massiliensis]